MFYCYNCEEYFDEPKVSKELMGEWCGQPAYDYFQVCPGCGDHDIEERHPCSICGSPARPRENYCDDCLALAKASIKNAMKPFVCLGGEDGDTLDLLIEGIEEVDRELTRKATRDNERDRVSKKRL